MSIVNRMGRALRANLNSLLTSDHPERVIAEAVAELQHIVKQAQRDRITAMGGHKRLDQEAKELATEAQRWEERAALALRHGDEALAREALQQKLTAQRRAEHTQRDAEQHLQAGEQLMQTIERVETEVRELNARKGALVADVLAARSRGPSGAVTHLGPTHLGEAWSHATDRVTALEAEIEAASVLDDPKRIALEARFNALTQQTEDGEVDDQLRDLKASLADKPE